MEITIPILNCSKCGSVPDRRMNPKLYYIWLECPKCRPFRRTSPYKLSVPHSESWKPVIREWNLMNQKEK